jgi:hypothetical protein
MMRDRRFIAEHRGGPLGRGEHYQLMKWACGCAEHVLYLFGAKVDRRLQYALEVAERWRQGKATVGEARKASLEAIAVAQESSNPTAIAVARAVGHAAAAAHMADHSLEPALYALKAVKSAGKSVEAERKWQDERLPPEIRELVLTSEKQKYLRRMFSGERQSRSRPW